MKLAIIAAVLAAPLTARADRPVLAGETTFGEPGGEILVHYATTGVDAPNPADTDADGVPDFVQQVAQTAEDALEHFQQLGFRRPLDDGARGGDGRIDIYLRDLQSADGNAGTDSCTGNHCIGYIAAENDYAGYAYSSVTEGIRSVVPHELFHLVQDAYASGQSSTWTEGSAVWAVENLYGDGNSDFERFLPTFIEKSFRPFERPVGGFGDGYPYGAALWPYFLEHAYGVDTVVHAWEQSETAPFLDATDAALAATGSNIDDAFVEFTRWNLFTGARASGGHYPQAAAWARVPIEAAGNTVYIEGLSARYLPISVAERSRISLAPPAGLDIAAWLVADEQSFDDGIALERNPADLSADVDAGAYTLVVTGLTRNSIATAVPVTIGAPTAPPDDTDDGGGGCSAARGASPWMLLALVGWLARPRRLR